MNIFIIYTTGATLYGKAVKDSTPWGDDAVALAEQVGSPGIYLGTTDNPYVFIQAGVSPADTDAFFGKIDDFHYGTVERGDLFSMTRLHAWDWQNATLTEKVRALYTATAIIDQFNFIGEKVDPDQRLSFPRQAVCENAQTGEVTTMPVGGVDGVPVDIEESAYIIAEALLSGRDPNADFEAQRVKVETFGPIRTEFATDKGPMQHTQNLVPSPSAWAKILPFLAITTSFDVDKG